LEQHSWLLIWAIGAVSLKHPTSVNFGRCMFLFAVWLPKLGMWAIGAAFMVVDMGDWSSITKTSNKH
jgi:hypothetical protein